MRRTLLALAALGLAALIFGCGPLHIPSIPQGPICGSNKGCDCWAFYLDGDWKYRVCPTPTPTPCVCEPKPECPDGSTVQTDGHGPFPCGCPIYSCTEPPEIPSPIPVPTPSPIPTVAPTIPPDEPPCPDIAAIGTKVQLFQFNHQAVTGHQEGDTWVANGPADKLSLDSTVSYGCPGPRCDSEHNPALAKCEDYRGPVYRVLSGPVRNCQPGNPGEDGRGFALNCDVAHPSTGSWEVCTVDPWISSETGLRVGGHACKVSNWRIP